jgi:hypothetical protein
MNEPTLAELFPPQETELPPDWPPLIQMTVPPASVPILTTPSETVPTEALEEPDDSPVFDPVKFEAFCGKLWIDSKEMGRVRLKFLSSQRYLVEQIAAGLARGVHTFVVLKGRQIGISTVLLAFDIYWMFKFGGLQGAVVTDTDENREVFRSLIDQYIKTLPLKARASVKRHNRVQLILKNASRLMYMVAGTKKKGDLGRAKSANYMHATECSSWGDEEGFGSLVNTLAQKNPHRLYVLESTARGYNMFYQTWEVAKKSHTQCAIFIGWWLNELYQVADDSIEYKTFWDGELTSDERVWVREVFELYGREITPNQIAWWRWYVSDAMKGDEMHALQEMPPTEEYAFQLSGSKFFSAERVNKSYQRTLKQECLYFKYVFGLNFEDTQFIETDIDNAEVTIWETPVHSGMPNALPGAKEGVYVCGADPAYGSSEWADEFAASMMRCYADKLVQVCELGTPNWNEQQFAWALLHLCGWYGGPRGNSMLSLEMQGPGGAVFNEIMNVKKLAATLPKGDPRQGAFDVVGLIRDYLWKKQDAIMGSYAYQWQTNSKEKIRMMSTFRGYYEREALELNSPLCVQQLRNIHRQGDQIGGEGRAKDDRVIAAAIATVTWNDSIMLEMQASGRTWHIENRPTEQLQAFSPLEKSVVNYLKRQGVQVRGITPVK